MERSQRGLIGRRSRSQLGVFCVEMLDCLRELLFLLLQKRVFVGDSLYLDVERRRGLSELLVLAGQLLALGFGGRKCGGELAVLLLEGGAVGL